MNSHFYRVINIPFLASKTNSSMTNNTEHLQLQHVRQSCLIKIFLHIPSTDLCCLKSEVMKNEFCITVIIEYIIIQRW